MATHRRAPIQDVLDTAAERDRSAQMFEAADVAYRRAGAKDDPSLGAWVNALPDGLSE